MLLRNGRDHGVVRTNRHAAFLQVHADCPINVSRRIAERQTQAGRRSKFLALFEVALVAGLKIAFPCSHDLWVPPKSLEMIAVQSQGGGEQSMRHSGSACFNSATPAAVTRV